MRFSFADAFILSVTNLTVVCIGPSKSERTSDSRYRFLLVSMMINFVILQTCLGLLLYFFNTGRPTFLDSWNELLLNPANVEELQKLNMIVSSLNLSGVSNISLILATKYSRLNSDRSAGQILKSMESEYLEFMTLPWEKRRRKINQLLTRDEIHPEFLAILQHANKRYFGVGSKHLIWSIENNNYELFQAVIQQSAVDLNIRDAKGRTPLTEAIYNKRGDMWRLLLQRRKVDVNKAGERGTPLTLAIKMKYEEAFSELLKHEATDLFAVDDDGFTPLALAIWRGEEEFAKALQTDKRNIHKLLEQVLLTKDMFKGWSPLTMAIYRGYNEILSFLLNKANIDIDFNVILPNKFSPLTWAIWKGNHVLFDLILQRQEVDINAQDGWNHTPVQFVKETKRPLLLKALRERRNVDLKEPITKYMSQLRRALSRAIAKNNSIAFGSILIEITRWPDMDLNQVDELGETPLTWAITNGRPHMVKSLLSLMDQTAQEASTEPLQLSLFSTFEVFEHVFSRLKKKGAVLEDASIESVQDININLDNGSMTPLISSIIKNDMKMFELLISCPSIDVNLQDSKSRTPLTEAVAFRRLRMLRTLLKRSEIEVNKIGRAGWSPLTRAASPEGNVTMVWHLLQHPEIKIDMLDGREQTALQSSLMSGDLNVIRLLSTGSQTYINMRTQMRELEKKLCSREDIDVNRPGYADYIPLNYAQDDVKRLLQRVNQRRNRNNNQPGKNSVMMAENQSLYESDMFEAGDQVESILCRTYSM